MKIMLVGSDKVYAIENVYAKYLQELNVVISRFNAQSYFYDYYYKNLLNKIIFRSGFSRIYSEINKRFIEQIRQDRPDVVWVFKGMEILPDSLRTIRKLGILLVNHNPDNPFLFTGKGSGNSNVTRSLHLYDLHFTYSLDIRDELMRSTRIRTELLPFGYDISDSVFAEACTRSEVVGACFLGNPDAQRADFVTKLAELGVKVDIYGNHWDKYLTHSNLRLKGPVYGQDFWNTLRQYRVQLNMMRIHNQEGLNMRTFEVPGIGGIMLAPDTKEHRGFFDIGKEIFVYSNEGDCAEQISRILNLTVYEADAIRASARAKSENAGYDYRSRSAFALKCIQSLNE
jgi:hypothetical protein